MNFREAVTKMALGKKVRRKTWLKDDYIYIENNVIYCDGGFSYLTYFRSADFKANDWVLCRRQ